MKKQLHYEDHIRQALEHINDTVWLEQNSPLATPYFLGVYLSQQPAANSPSVVLRQLLMEAADTLWNGELPQTRAMLRKMALEARGKSGISHPCYLYYIVELRYLRRYYPPSHFPNSVKNMYSYLDSSKTRFSHHLKEAIQSIAEEAARRTMPAARLETPAPPTLCVGRKGVMDNILHALRDGDSVSLSGGVGVGKTTVATAVRAAWSEDRAMIFWYTIRLNMTDHLSGLLFALGVFFYRLDALNLWRQLIAAPERLEDVNTALAYIRADVELLGKRPLLFCFDEMDLLGVAHERTPTRSILLELIIGLSDIVPCLFIGQINLIDTPHYHQLSGLTNDGARDLITAVDVSVPDWDMSRLISWSEGNPRLIMMALSLIRSGDKVDDVIALSSQTPSIHPILERLWKRVDPQERLFLRQLSVFRSPTSRQSWQANQKWIGNLRQRDLLEEDENEGLLVRGVVRELIYAALSVEEREAYHEQAAQLRATLSEYTAAAHHFVQAGLYENGIRLWFEHRNLEIHRGKAEEARILFAAIPTRRVEGKERKFLRLIRDQLALMAGNGRQVIASSSPANWKDSLLKVDVWVNRAEAERDLGREENALSSYREAINTLARLTRQATRIRYLTSRLQVRIGDMEGAHQQMEYAHYDATHLRGFVYAHQGNLLKARDAFIEALAIATNLSHERGIALTADELALNAGQRLEGKEARQYAEMAMDYYHRIGDRYSLESTKAGLAGILKETGAYQQAIKLGEESLLYFKQTQSPDMIATIHTNLAEAYMEIGDWKRAREYALLAYHSETPYLRPFAMYTMGCLEERQGNDEQAKDIFLEGINVAKMNGNDYILAHFYHQLSFLYKRQEDESQWALYHAHAYELLPEVFDNG